MSIEEIFESACVLKKNEKIQLVNRILASIKDGRRPTPQEDDNVPTMPVYEALYAFSEIYRQKKGVNYAPNNKFVPRDFKAMKELLLKIEERIVESGVMIVTDALRLQNLRAFLEAVSTMKNQWYFENRFNPNALNNDFEIIYCNIKSNNGNARQQQAYSYL